MIRRSVPRRKGCASQRPLHVLHIINGLGPGGAETVLYRLVTHPSDVRHEIVSLERPNWYSRQLEEAGITVHHLDWSLSSAPLAAYSLFRLIQRSDADVVQTWMYRSNLVGGVLGRLTGKEVVWNIRCSSLAPLHFRSRLVAKLGGRLARWVPRFIINCSEESVKIHGSLGYDAAEGAVIPNGYDPGMLRIDDRSRSSTRRTFRVEPETFLIGTVGRWHIQKGIPILIEALRLLRQRGVIARLILTGRGLEARNEELSRLISASGCADQVQAIGERRDIPEIARALDLHVLASIGSEGFPNVVAETMVSGTPNVATAIGDAALIVGKTGWIVKPGDAAALADAIEAAYREWKFSPARWKRRREEARQRIIDNFTLERMVGRYEEVWWKVADAHALKPRAQ